MKNISKKGAPESEKTHKNYSKFFLNLLKGNLRKSNILRNY